MDCVKCGAPLAPRTSLCSFCGALNEIDLRSLESRYESTGVSDRICPRCEQPMQGVRIDAAGGMTLERCDNCLGLFFDPEEAEAVLDAGANPHAAVDLKRMQRIIEDEAPVSTHKSMYVKCPVCRKMMNRDKFGARSGVIVDRCAEHGVWMDGGELSQLLKWMRAGGKTLAERRRREEIEQQERKKRTGQLHIPMTNKSAASSRGIEIDLDDDWLLPTLLGAAVGFFLK